jgi:glycosyltransferase involved in cell wall biosynthesis
MPGLFCGWPWAGLEIGGQMRIVFLIDWFLYYTVELANALAEENDVLLVTRDHNFEISSPENPMELDEFMNTFLDRRVSWEKLRYRRRDHRNIAEIRRIWGKAKAFDPDVVHIQENKDWRILNLACMLGFQKTVLTIHDVVAHLGHPHQLIRYIKWITRWKARRIIVHGEYLKQCLMEKSKGLQRKIHVIPHGAFSIYNRFDDGTVFEEENSILFFGRVLEYKGLDVLVQSLSSILKKITNIKIIIAGKGEGDYRFYEERIHDKNFYEIHNRFIADSEVYKFFRRACVVVLPYVEASQSGIVPMAYAFGKPVVVTSVGSIPEVVADGQTGFVVPPRDPEALAEAIVRLMKDQKLRRSMGKKAKAKADTELSWESIAGKTKNVYALLRNSQQ